jgi:hypothetical protein
MPYKIKRDIVGRWEGNPIINRDNLSFTTNYIFCVGAVRKNGEYTLLATMEVPRGKTSIYLARSEDRYHLELMRNCSSFPILRSDTRFMKK